MPRMTKTANERLNRAAKHPRGRLRIEDIDPVYFDDEYEFASVVATVIHYDYIPTDVEDLITLTENGANYAG